MEGREAADAHTHAVQDVLIWFLLLFSALERWSSTPVDQLHIT